MPIYEYECGTCGKRFDHLARSSSEPAPCCPSCGTADVKKLMSSFSAAMGSSGSSCATGTCPTGTCATGTCPL